MQPTTTHFLLPTFKAGVQKKISENCFCHELSQVYINLARSQMCVGMCVGAQQMELIEAACSPIKIVCLHSFCSCVTNAIVTKSEASKAAN